MTNYDIPVLGIVAVKSNSGKTTLIELLIPLLDDRGIKVSVLKHIHHRFDLDKPGKDSFKFRQAGARQVMVASGLRWALLEETPRQPPTLADLIETMDTSAVDLVLVEGLKHEAIPKIEVSLNSSSTDLICRSDEMVIAVAAEQQHEQLDIPQFSINDTPSIATFILTWLTGRNPARYRHADSYKSNKED